MRRGFEPRYALQGVNLLYYCNKIISLILHSLSILIIIHILYSQACIQGIIEQPGSLGALLGMLYTADDEVCFFISLAVQRIIWKRWFNSSEEERNQIVTVYSQLLLEKGGSLLKYSKSKAEQVMAGLCAQSGTLAPVIHVLQQTSGDPARAVIGLSVLRTVRLPRGILEG